MAGKALQAVVAALDDQLSAPVALDGPPVVEHFVSGFNQQQVTRLA
jgi:hypothetical protein